MTGAGMIGTSVMTGVAMGTAMTIVGATIAASVIPTGAGMIRTSGMMIDAEMIGAPAITTGDGTIAISGMMIDADKSQPPYLAIRLLTGPGLISDLACVQHPQSNYPIRYGGRRQRFASLPQHVQHRPGRVGIIDRRAPYPTTSHTTACPAPRSPLTAPFRSCPSSGPRPCGPARPFRALP